MSGSSYFPYRALWQDTMSWKEGEALHTHGNADRSDYPADTVDNWSNQPSPELAASSVLTRRRRRDDDVEMVVVATGSQDGRSGEPRVSPSWFKDNPKDPDKIEVYNDKPWH